MAVLHLKAKPNARLTQLLPAPDGTSWTVRLQAPAQNGQANACLLTYLAGVFGVAKSEVVLLSGHASAFKKVDIRGRIAAEVQATLAGLLA